MQVSLLKHPQWNIIVMADQVLMFAATAGVFAASAALLFVARAKRYHQGFKPVRSTEEKSSAV
jgi:hypothetical protein